jgi:hypothetical protein
MSTAPTRCAICLPAQLPDALQQLPRCEVMALVLVLSFPAAPCPALSCLHTTGGDGGAQPLHQRRE